MSPASVNYDSPPVPDGPCDQTALQAVSDYTTQYNALVEQTSLEACVLKLLEDQWTANVEELNMQTITIQEMINADTVDRYVEGIAHLR